MSTRVSKSIDVSARASETRVFKSTEVAEVELHIQERILEELYAFIQQMLEEMPQEDEDGNEDEDLQAVANECIEDHLEEHVMVGVRAFTAKLRGWLVELKPMEPTPLPVVCAATRASASQLAREIVDAVLEFFCDGMNELVDEAAVDMPGDDELVEAAHDLMQTHLNHELEVSVTAFSNVLQDALLAVEKTRREKRGKKNKTRDCMICVGGGECVRHAKKAKA